MTEDKKGGSHGHLVTYKKLTGKRAGNHAWTGALETAQQFPTVGNPRRSMNVEAIHSEREFMEIRHHGR